MLIITGASGKTGQAVLQALTGQESVRCLVRRADQVQTALALGAAEVEVVDLRNAMSVQQGFQGGRVVYHICPNMAEDELDISRTVIAAAKESGVERLVFHSVLHPQVEAMPHHWAKMRVEEILFTCGMDFTILQPCAYMQNIQGYWDSIVNQGLLTLPYSTEKRFSLVDLNDVAEAAARVLLEDGHAGAIYELAGPQALSHIEIATELSQLLKRQVSAKRIAPETWEEQARAAGMQQYTRQTLYKMFSYYDKHGFVGSPQVLSWLLGRLPTQFSGFAARIVSGG